MNKCIICGKNIESGTIGPECIYKIKKKIIKEQLNSSVEYKENFKVVDQNFLHKKLLREQRIPQKKINVKSQNFIPYSLDIMLSLYDQNEFSLYDGESIYNTILDSSENVKNLLSNYEFHSFLTPFYSDDKVKFLGSLILKSKSNTQESLLIPLYSSNENIYYKSLAMVNIPSDNNIEVTFTEATGNVDLQVEETESISHDQYNVLVSTSKDEIESSSAQVSLNDFFLGKNVITGKKIGRKARYNLDMNDSIENVFRMSSDPDTKYAFEAISAKEIEPETRKIIEDNDKALLETPIEGLKKKLAIRLSNRISNNTETELEALALYDNPLYNSVFHRLEFANLVRLSFKEKNKNNK